MSRPYYLPHPPSLMGLCLTHIFLPPLWGRIKVGGEGCSRLFIAPHPYLPPRRGEGVGYLIIFYNPLFGRGMRHPPLSLKSSLELFKPHSYILDFNQTWGAAVDR